LRHNGKRPIQRMYCCHTCFNYTKTGDCSVTMLHSFPALYGTWDSEAVLKRFFQSA
jgi:hypothetical protein